jgi:hypothetical protein
MIDLKQKEIAITIPTDSPAETLSGLQSGIIEMVKTILSMGSEGNDLEVDRPTANGCVSALELLEATLIDPEILEATMCIADQVSSIKNQVSRIRGTLSEVLPGATTWISEAETWLVAVN